MLPDFDVIIAVTLAGLALSLTPGPSMLYVLSRSVGQSRSAGLASAAGLGLGGLLLAVGTALGLASLFERAAWLVTLLSYAGSAYMAWRRHDPQLPQDGGPDLDSWLGQAHTNLRYRMAGRFGGVT